LKKNVNSEMIRVMDLAVSEFNDMFRDAKRAYS
jgi:hypothetical protein